MIHFYGIILFACSWAIQTLIFAQITMPVSGTSSTSTCSQTFYDPGGASFSADYATGVLTICPSAAGTYARVTFTDFFSYEISDYLFVYDGNSTNAPLLGGYSGTTLPPVITATSSNTSRCLTFKVASEGNIDWIATISCSATPGVAPTFDNRDCYQSEFICTDVTFSGNSNGANVEELMSHWIPCASTGERQSSWYYFRIATSGLLGLTISPDPFVDYDFAIWGPYSTLRCPVNTFHTPVRCSYSQEGGDTGLGNGAFDNSEDATGDKWVADLPVSAGDVYILNINNFSQDFTPFSLLWNLQNGASFNCIPLPVGFTAFTGKSSNHGNILEWKTFFEENNDRYEVERSANGSEFKVIGSVSGSGTSQSDNTYSFIDPSKSVNGYYYRLRQVDYNGNFSHSNVILLKEEDDLQFVNLFPNPGSNFINMAIQSLMAAEVKIEIMNSLAQVVYSDIREIPQGHSVIEVSIKNLPIGIYQFKVITTSGEFPIEKQFIKSE